MSRVLAVGDIHAPAHHPGYLDFCKKVKKKYKCDRVVIIGDVLDHHVISFHDKHPEAPGVMDEYNKAVSEVSRWHKAFPDANVTIGNHDERHLRIGSKNEIPSIYFKDFNTLFNTPSWTWATSVTIDNVFYHHGNGIASSSAVLPAATVALKTGQSAVLGHFHTKTGVVYYNVNGRQIFGLQLGCGVDNDHPAMAYSKSLYHNVMSCGVIIDGHSAYVETFNG